MTDLDSATRDAIAALATRIRRPPDTPARTHNMTTEPDLTPLIALLAELLTPKPKRFRCLDCGTRRKPHWSRGLCSTCYHRRQRNHTLHERPCSRRRAIPPIRSRPALARFEDYTWLRGYHGGHLTMEQAAARIGIDMRTAFRYERRMRAMAAAPRGAA